MAFSTETLNKPLNLNRSQPIHFVGIGGVGMSGLAKILLESGFPVSGSDRGSDGFAGLAPVAGYPANAYGLYDVAGNAWEWVSDWYRPDYYATLAAQPGVARNPRGPETSFDPAEPREAKRVHRGGSFLCVEDYCTRYMIGTRGKGEVRTASNHVGFRCVRAVPKT